LVEDAIAQMLRRLDLGVGLGQADFERAGRRQHGPLDGTAFKGSGLVDVDQPFLPFDAKSVISKEFSRGSGSRQTGGALAAIQKHEQEYRRKSDQAGAD